MRMSYPGIRKRIFSVLVVSLTILPLLQSCKKDTELLKLSPNGGRIDGIVAEGVTMVVYTIDEDSVKTDSLRSNILGAMNDPEFGKSEATLITQVQLPEINIDFDGVTSPDSVILSIPYKINSQLYGNSNNEQTIRVYRLEEQLVASKSYYSNYTFQKGNLLGEWTGTMNTEDSVYYIQNGVEIRDVPQLRIHLDSNFGKEFFTADPTVYSGKGAFLDFLKGFVLEPDASAMASGDGAIAEIDLASLAAKLTIYYGDSLTKAFPITPESERVNTYKHADIDPDIQAQLDQPGVNYNVVYAQSMSGTKIKIDLPDIFDLVADGRIAINEAKLTIPVKSGSSSDAYDVPPRLLLLQPSEADGSNDFILDLIDQILPPSVSWIGYSNYGGGYDAQNEQYVFRFNRHLQQLLDEYYTNGVDNNRGLYIVIPSDNPVTPARLIIDNDAGGTGRKVELKITYTKL